MLSSRRLLVCIGFCAWASSTVLGWGPGIHKKLAMKYYEDPMIAGFAAEFGTDVSAVVNGAGDLDFVGDPHHEIYHRGQWTMVVAREYVYRPASPTDWFDLDETTRLKYMMHNLGDVAVPIGHSPANQNPNAPPGTMKEAFLEGLADLGSYGSPSLYTGMGYTGTISDCVSQYYTEQMALVSAYVDAGGSNQSACSNGWRVSQKLAKVVLTDYYLAKRPAADAGPDITVGPGQMGVFSATDLRDPDNIIWDTSGDGTYAYSASWTGITQVRWDLDGDGTYETTGLEITKPYSELASLIGPNSIGTFGIEVVDDEGNVTYDTATLTTVPEPLSVSLLLVGGLFRRRRRKR